VRRTATRGFASLIGAASCLFIASELYRDLAGRMRHFVAPDWWKVAVMVALLWLAMQETAKVHGRLEEILG
jgi:uncharacterized membrane protein required for colicin V production